MRIFCIIEVTLYVYGVYVQVFKALLCMYMYIYIYIYTCTVYYIGINACVLLNKYGAYMCVYVCIRETNL